MHTAEAYPSASNTANQKMASGQVCLQRSIKREQVSRSDLPNPSIKLKKGAFPAGIQAEMPAIRQACDQAGSFGEKH
jgi:hypothetical protein